MRDVPAEILRHLGLALEEHSLYHPCPHPSGQQGLEDPVEHNPVSDVAYNRRRPPPRGERPGSRVEHPLHHLQQPQEEAYGETKEDDESAILSGALEGHCGAAAASRRELLLVAMPDTHCVFLPATHLFGGAIKYPAAYLETLSANISTISTLIYVGKWFASLKVVHVLEGELEMDEQPPLPQPVFGHNWPHSRRVCVCTELSVVCTENVVAFYYVECALNTH